MKMSELDYCGNIFYILQGRNVAAQETCLEVDHEAFVRHIHVNMMMRNQKSTAIRDSIWGVLAVYKAKHMEEL